MFPNKTNAIEPGPKLHLRNSIRNLINMTLVAQTLHHLCRVTAVALHWCRIFRLMFSHLATPLKVSQKRPCRTL